MKQVIGHAWFRTVEGKQRVLAKEQVEGLLSFHRTNALEHAVLVDVAMQLPIAQLHEMTRAFEAMDADGSGRLDANELTQAFVSSGLSVEQAAVSAERLATDYCQA